MKKILFPLCAIALVGMALAANPVTHTTRASETAAGLTTGDETPDFNDDFESYANYDAMATNWTNGYFEHTGDGNQEACAPGKTDPDEGYKDRFAIVNDPLDQGHGKVLLYCICNN